MKRPELIRRWLTVLLWLSGLFSSSYVAAQPDEGSPGEIQIKAAFLYKFTGYVEWPKSSFKDTNSPITIGVVAADEIADELRHMVSGRTMQSRPLNVIEISKESDLSGVHVLFIGRDANARLARLIEAVRQRPILAVTDIPDGLDRGGMINFVIAKRRVQFEIAVDAAEKAGLVLSSRLLSVALRVKKGNIEPDTYLALLDRAVPLWWSYASAGGPPRLPAEAIRKENRLVSFV